MRRLSLSRPPRLHVHALLLEAAQPPHQHMILAVAFSPDGETVLTGSFDNTARLWDGHGQAARNTLAASRGVVAVAFSPDGKSVATGSDDKTARLWRVPRPIEGDPERILLGSSATKLPLQSDQGPLHLVIGVTGNRDLCEGDRPLLETRLREIFADLKTH